MKKTIPAGLLAALLLLSSCGGAPAQEDDGKLHIVATTYPVYLFTTAVTEGVEGVEVSLMLNQPTSCLHDYTLTVTDMKALERAEVVVMSGAGLEDFMSDALGRTTAQVIDCSAGIDLLPYEEGGHDDHDHEEDGLGHEEADHDGHDHGEYDPHIWMDPRNAAAMVGTISAFLSGLDLAHAADYQANAAAAQAALAQAWEGWRAKADMFGEGGIITFHDGFRYFSEAFDLDLLKAIEEEEGAETSAKEIKEIADLILTAQRTGAAVPAVFTEVNGSDATAKAIARETGIDIHQLTMIMSGSGSGIGAYIDAMDFNIDAILEALK